VCDYYFCLCPWQYYYLFSVIDWNNLNNAMAFFLWDYVSSSHYPSAWSPVCSVHTHTHTHTQHTHKSCVSLLWWKWVKRAVKLLIFGIIFPAVIMWACVEMEPMTVGWVGISSAVTDSSSVSLLNTQSPLGSDSLSFHWQPLDHFAVYAQATWAWVGSGKK
jgi:hypothetical protein